MQENAWLKTLFYGKNCLIFTFFTGFLLITFLIVKSSKIFIPFWIKKVVARFPPIFLLGGIYNLTFNSEKLKYFLIRLASNFNFQAAGNNLMKKNINHFGGVKVLDRRAWSSWLTAFFLSKPYIQRSLLATGSNIIGLIWSFLLTSKELALFPQPP